MKKSTLVKGLILGLSFAAFGAQAEEAAAVNEAQLRKDMGYFFGYSFANMLKQGGNTDVDPDTLLQGLKDSLAGVQPALSEEAQRAIVARIQANQEALQTAMQQRQQQEAAANSQSGAAFLAENAVKEGVTTTDSGLQYMVLTEGTGPAPAETSTVKVHYEGRLINGSVFDSSYDRGQPAEFRLNQVISGWTEGLQLMKTGGKSRLFIPSDLAYGPGGAGSVPPNAVLIFDVELLEVK